MKKIIDHKKRREIEILLDEILERLRSNLGEKLVGLYLYGSLVAGDFDYEVSDIDLLAATETIINDQEFAALEKMYAELSKKFPRWDNRIETAYVSLDALRTFKTKLSRIANTSPGEPLHFLDAGRDWLLNWYFVRESGVILFGPPPGKIVPEISQREFIEAVREQAQERAANVDKSKNSRPYQAYLIMTMCRALYAVRNGEQVSKKRAAEWTKKKFPEFAALIENAFEWRARNREKVADPGATFEETKRFVLFIAEMILNDG
jgi:predicted nucleotidyltransferase